MNPVTESRFLPPFLATTASIVLVCGGLLLLTSTAPWTSREEAASDASVPRSAERAAKPSPPAQIALAPSTSAGGSLAGAETPEADHGENTQVVEAPQADTQQAAPRPAHDTAAADVPGANDSETHASDVPQADENEDTSDGPQVDETEAGATEAIAPESMIASDAEPMAENTVEPGAVLETAPVNTEAAETPAAAEAPPPATDQIGEMLKETAPKAVAVETISEDTGGAAGNATASEAAKTTSGAGPATPEAAKPTGGAGPSASPDVTAAAPLPPPPPPKPKRNPEIETKAPAQKARTAPRPERPSRPEPSKKDQARPAVAQQTQAQPQSRPLGWLPMALAPANKPIAKQPATKVSGPAYASKVWGALARHKPRAGQRGSATVVFSVGASGALGGVRIGQSSGNSRIDQLALATVRGAAPFPPPPSGPASFSIRIDFH
jgi:periplasmic protein TonB